MLIELPKDWAELKRPKASARRGDWYRIEAKTDAPAEVYIYDEIGAWGTTAQQFTKDLMAIKSGQINLHLNTPGGDVFDGIAIHNALRQHPANVNVSVDSLAASIGSVIAMAGNTITMAKHSTMMIHDPYGFAMGNAADMRQMAEVLSQLGDTIAGVYAERAGGSIGDWRARMLDETWYNDRSAVEAGLADSVAGDEAAQNSFDLSHFRHPPADLAKPGQSLDGPEPTKRDIERALRDAGLTRAQAKGLLALGYSGIGDESEDEREVTDLSALLDAIKRLNN